MPSLETTMALLGHYGYFLLLPAAVIEGPIITVIAGVFISLGYMTFWPAYIIIVLGDTIGDALHYALGRYGGMHFVHRWGKYVGFKESHVLALEKVFDGHEGKAFTLGKLAHGFGGALLVAAGIIKMDFKKFLFWNVVGTLPKTLLLLAIGYYFAHTLQKVNSILDLMASATIFLGAVGFLIWFYVYGKKQTLS